MWNYPNYLVDLKLQIKKPLLFFVILILFVSIHVKAVQSHDSDSVISQDKILEALRMAARGSTSQLQALAETGGSGAWYALSEAALEFGYPQLVQYLRKQSWRKDSTPFASIALSKLILQDANSFWFPQVKIWRAVKRSGETPLLREAKIKVLWKSNNQRALARELKNFTGAYWEAPVLGAAIVFHKERTELTDLLERFILHCPKPEALNGLPRRLDGFVSEERAFLFEARKKYAVQSYSESLMFFRQWLNRIKKTLPTSSKHKPSPVFAEIADAARRLGEEGFWANFLYESSEALSGAVCYAASYQAGELFLGNEDYSKSSQAFMRAALSLTRGLDVDRALWNYLKTIQGAPFSTTGEEVEAFSQVAGMWEKPQRFTDKLEWFVHRRVSRGEWEVLRDYYQKWGSRLPAGSKAHVALALAIKEAYLKTGSSQEYLEAAYASAPLSWWGMRAAGILDRGISLVPSAGKQEQGSSDLEGDVFLKWGLVARLAKMILAEPENYSDATIRRVSQALSASAPRLSIRIIGLLFYRAGYSPDRDDLFLRFPFPYEAAVKEVASAYQIPLELYLGLIRTESAWDARAVSHTGAQGLTQFMPATWEEWEDRLRYPEDSDPMNPSTSLKFGAAYLRWLYNREWTYNWVDVLASYNAGGGRVRYWHQTRPGLGADIFGISIPIEEPRFYVSRVFSAATLYGYLYGERSPRDLHKSWNFSFLTE